MVRLEGAPYPHTLPPKNLKSCSPCMELVLPEQEANLIAPGMERSDVPHPWDDYGEVVLPLHKKVLLVLASPLLFLLVILRILLLLVLAVLLVLVCCAFGSRRCIIQPLVVALGRLFLLAFGVWPGMLQVTKPAGLEPAPVLALAPHVGGLEAFVMMYDGMPRAIAMETYARLPVISSIFHASGGIAVPVPATNDEARKARQGKAKVAPAELPAEPAAAATDAPVGAARKPAEKRSAAVRNAIAAHKKGFNPADPANRVPLCILPEGTTHSGRSLIKFFSGAFEGGGPIQPVLLSYPYVHFHAAFFGRGLGDHAFRLLVNPWQRVEVTYLPVYHPTAEEQVDADLYAENVRLAMAAAAGLPPSRYGAKALRQEYLEKQSRSGGA